MSFSVTRPQHTTQVKASPGVHIYSVVLRSSQEPRASSAQSGASQVQYDTYSMLYASIVDPSLSSTHYSGAATKTNSQW